MGFTRTVREILNETKYVSRTDQNCSRTPLFLINSRILVLIASFKSVLEHLQFRCCS
jgi:hypothetical protein